MALWFNLVLAWVTVALAVLLVIIWGLRLINKKKKIPWVQKLNCALRRRHKLIGILLIITSLVHGILSSDVLLSFNWGTALLIVAALLGLVWLLRKKLKLKKWWMYIHRALTAVFAALLVIHVINVGGILIDDLIAGRLTVPSADSTVVLAVEDTALAEDFDASEEVQESTEATQLPDLPHGNGNGNHNANNISSDTSLDTSSDTADSPAATPAATPAASPDTTAAVYKDGVYTGTGTGYRPGLVVEVVIENGMITTVTVTEHNEKNEMFWGVPVELIPQLIVESQSTDVDTVSGATMTSRGIIEAVNDALEQAAG